MIKWAVIAINKKPECFSGDKLCVVSTREIARSQARLYQKKYPNDLKRGFQFVVRKVGNDVELTPEQFLLT